MWVETENHNLVNLSNVAFLERKKDDGIYAHVLGVSSPVPIYTTAGLKEWKILRKVDYMDIALQQLMHQIGHCVKKGDVQLYGYHDGALRSFIRSFPEWSSENALKFVDVLDANINKKRPILELNFSARIKNALIAQRINTVGELCERSSANLIKIQFIGPAALVTIKRELSNIGLSLATERGI